MLNESRLNIYVLGSDLSPRQRQRIQAQVHTALRSLPVWVFDLLHRRIEALGVSTLPLVVEPHSAAAAHRVLSLGQIESRPAVKIKPRLLADGVDWGQDLARLLAKSIAYVLAPDDIDADFWRRWKRAAAEDRLRDRSAAIAEAYEDETDLGFFIEMFAAYALTPAHSRWAEFREVRTFFENWRGSAG